MNKAREAQMLFAEGFGVHIPRAMQRLIAAIPLVAAAASMIWPAFAVAAILYGTVQVINNFEALKKKTFEVRDAVFEASQRINGLFLGHDSPLGSAKAIEAAIKATEGMRDAVSSMWDQAAMAGKQGVNAVNEQATQMAEKLTNQRIKQLREAHAQYLSDSETFLAIESQTDKLLAEGTVVAHLWKNAQLAKLRHDDLEALKKSQAEAVEVTLTGVQLAMHKEAEAIRVEREKAKDTGLAENLTGEIAAIRTKTTGEIEKMGRDWKDEIDRVVEEAQKSGTTGIAAVENEIGAKLTPLHDKFLKEFGTTFLDDPNNPENAARYAAWLNSERQFTRALEAVRQNAAERIKVLESGMGGETQKAEEAAGNAGLPSWLKGLVGSTQQRDETLRQVNQWEQEMLKGLSQGSDQYVFIEEQAQRRRVAAYQQANNEILEQMRQVRDQLAGELESVFDDITSGNIGKRILDEIKHLFFKIVAQWILAMNSMKGASGGLFGNSILGSLFGGLFGMGGGGGGGDLTDAQIFGGAGSSGGGLTGSGAAGMITAGTGPIPLFGGGISSGTGTAGAVSGQGSQAAMANTVLGGLLSKVFTHGIGSGKFALSGPALGSMGAMIGLQSILGAYSSGSPLMGALGGAAGGIMTGFAIGGPLGAAVGAGMFLASIISGIFGKKKKEQQAWDLVLNKYAPAIQQVVDGYANFQMQYQDAMSQLDQVESQAKGDLHQLGSTGNKIFASGIPWRIDDARKKIQGWEHDRQGRGAVNFGAPLFDLGGYVGNGSHTLGILRDDEFVMNPGATRRNRATLERMNAGGDGGEIHVHFHTIDGPSTEKWLRNGGARTIRNALRGQTLEYSGDGIV